MLLLLLFVRYLYLMLKLKHEEQKRLIYSNQALQHILRTELNIENLTCDKLKDTFNVYIYDFAYMNKIGNRFIQPWRIGLTKAGECQNVAAKTFLTAFSRNLVRWRCSKNVFNMKF